MSTNEYTYTKDQFDRLKQICVTYRSIHARLREAKIVFDWVIGYEDALFLALLIDKIDLGEDPFEGEQIPVLRNIIKEGAD